MIKILHSIFTFVFTLLLCITVSAQTDTLKTTFGEGADTYVSNDEQYSDLPPDGSGPESVHGADIYLKIRNHEVRMKIVYLKFDITDNPMFDGANEAFLGLYVTHAGKMAESELVVSVYGMTDDSEDYWVDTMMSYSTAPGMAEAELNEYDLDYSMTEWLTELTVSLDYTGYAFTEPTQEMDDFINADENGLLTFILLVEEVNTGDELRLASEEDTANNAPPLLHAGDPVIGIEENTLANFKLNQNYPNPFNGNTTLSYKLNEPKHVELKIYNVLGNEVVTLVNDFQSSGEYNINLNMNTGTLELPSGVYFARITAGSNRKTIRMIFNK